MMKWLVFLLNNSGWHAVVLLPDPPRYISAHVQINVPGPPRVIMLRTQAVTVRMKSMHAAERPADLAPARFKC
jgi:hypothetical protein